MTGEQVDQMLDQLEFQSRGGEIVHLLDFSLLRDLLPPTFQARRRESLQIQEVRWRAHFMAVEYFRGLTEPIALPPGAVLEFSTFLRAISQELESLPAILSRASQSDFDLAVKNIESQLTSLAKTPDSRTAFQLPLSLAPEIQRILELSEYDRSLENILNVLRNKCMRSWRDILPAGVVHVPGEIYGRVRRELQALDVAHRTERANQADALNLAVTISLNRPPSIGQTAPPKTVYKLVTGSPSLFRIEPSIESQVRFRDASGYAWDLLEHPRSAVLRRAIARRVCRRAPDDRGEHEELLSFRMNVEQAKATVRRLSTATAALPQPRLLRPYLTAADVSPEFVDFLIAHRTEIDSVSRFVVDHDEISRPLLRAGVRASIVGDRTRGAMPEFVEQHVEQAKSTLSAIASLLSSLGDVGKEVSPEQLAFLDSGRFNVVLSLSRLGYSIAADKEPGATRAWMLRDGDTTVLTVADFGTTLVIRWNTVGDLLSQLLHLREEIPFLKELSAEMFLVYADGEEAEIRVNDVADSLLSEVVFARLEHGPLAYVSELHNVDESMLEQTGFLLDRDSEFINIEAIMRVFLGQTGLPIPLALLVSEFWERIRSDLTERPA